MIETANERISLIDEITERNCNYVFEDYYTSLLELLQALLIKYGFSVRNHICIGVFLRDALKDMQLYLDFDSMRKRRNSLTYYGNKMEYAQCKEAISRCKALMKKIKRLLNH